MESMTHFINIIINNHHQPLIDDDDIINRISWAILCMAKHTHTCMHAHMMCQFAWKLAAPHTICLAACQKTGKLLGDQHRSLIYI